MKSSTELMGWRLPRGVAFHLHLLLWIFMPVWELVPQDYEERAGG